MRILVVEDEAKVARALQEGLEREEYDVVVARSGEEGFYLVSAEEFDLVILVCSAKSPFAHEKVQLSQTTLT